MNAPFNENIFDEHEFAPSIVTDRELPSTSTGVAEENDEGFLNASFTSVAAFEEIVDNTEHPTHSTPLRSEHEDESNYNM